MPASTENLWSMGAQFMAAVQARDAAATAHHLRAIMAMIAAESQGRFSYYKLRMLQVLTNANRAAFNAGASPQALGVHSLRMVRAIDRVATSAALERLALVTVRRTVRLVPAANAYRERIVRDAINHIRSNYAAPLSRDLMAARLQCSPAHFSRVFSRTTGYSYKDFLLQYRIERAKGLLQHSYLHIAEIAHSVGYEDAFQFSRIFRHRVGVSPRQFRMSRHGR